MGWGLGRALFVVLAAPTGLLAVLWHCRLQVPRQHNMLYLCCAVQLCWLSRPLSSCCAAAVSRRVWKQSCVAGTRFSVLVCCHLPSSLA